MQVCSAGDETTRSTPRQQHRRVVGTHLDFGHSSGKFETSTRADLEARQQVADAEQEMSRWRLRQPNGLSPDRHACLRWACDIVYEFSATPRDSLPEATQFTKNRERRANRRGSTLNSKAKHECLGRAEQRRYGAAWGYPVKPGFHILTVTG